MPRYIDADALKSKVQAQEYKGDPAVLMALGWVHKTIDYAPTSDVAPVRRGKWILLVECSNEGVYCSACAKKVYKTDYANQKTKSKYCPNCGALME